jgi:hypothetical protein
MVFWNLGGLKNLLLVNDDEILPIFTREWPEEVQKVLQ